jgi:hypothetical protein
MPPSDPQPSLSTPTLPLNPPPATPSPLAGLAALLLALADPEEPPADSQRGVQDLGPLS